MASYLPYHELDAVSLLIFSSFLLLLNIVGWTLDLLMSCGLVTQIFIGVGWGIPGGNWLTESAQKTIMQLGYIGLLLMVYEGGLDTPFKVMKANFVISLTIALTGIALPIAASFLLLPIVNASPVAAFSAGAALCSTSLGTVLTILASAGLKSTKIGVVLTSSAVIDDIAGLIMMQVVSNLGDGEFTAAIVIRPVFVSFGLIIVVGIFCYFLLLPLSLRVISCLSSAGLKLSKVSVQRAIFVMHTFILLGLVVAAIYAGASSLTAAYVTGAAISWWDTELSRLRKVTSNEESEIVFYFSCSEKLSAQNEEMDECSVYNVKSNNIKSLPYVTGARIFEKYYSQPLLKILKPFFFASIGFSIPVRDMFHAELVWRGIIYSLLMFLSKFVCGIWILLQSYMNSYKEKQNHTVKGSVHGGILLGLAMVPRGEIGFLIASLAESKKVFSSSGGNEGVSDVYVVVTWAIVLCTFIGPILVGGLVKLLERGDTNEYKSSSNMLGIWGKRSHVE